jgi:hypothetical protein
MTSSALKGYLTGSALTNYVTTGAFTLKNLLPPYDGNDRKVLGLTGGAVEWVSQTGNLIMFPDYTATEPTINRITGSGIRWKVDRDGYVTFGVTVQSTSAVTSWLSVYINNKTVYRDVARDLAVSPDSMQNVLPVSKGDTVAIAGEPSTGIFCYFIPPKYSKPPAPIVVEGGDYLEGEQPVMVYDKSIDDYRPKEWIDGSAIYQMTITWTTPSTGLAANGTDTIGNVSGIKNILEQSVVANVKFNMGAVMLSISGTDAITIRNDTTLSFGGIETWYITIQYTKV